MPDLSFFFVSLSILFSLLFFGLRRSAIWLVPVLFSMDYLLDASLVVFSFLTACFVFVPYKNGAFDFSAFKKERWTIVFFISGVLSGFLKYPAGLFYFGMGVFGPLVFTHLCDLFRWPLVRVYFFPSLLRWLLFIIFIGLAAAIKLGYAGSLAPKAAVW